MGDQELPRELTALRFDVSRFRFAPTHRYCMNASRTDAHTPPGDVRIMAKTIAAQMRRSGYDHRDVVALATELIGIVSAAMAANRED